MPGPGGSLSGTAPEVVAGELALNWGPEQLVAVWPA